MNVGRRRPRGTRDGSDRNRRPGRLPSGMAVWGVAPLYPPAREENSRGREKGNRLRQGEAPNLPAPPASVAAADRGAAAGPGGGEVNAAEPQRPGRRVEGAHLYVLELLEFTLLWYDKTRNRRRPAPYKLHGLLEHWLVPVVVHYYHKYHKDPSEVLRQRFPTFLKELRRIGIPQGAAGSTNQEGLKHVPEWLEQGIRNRLGKGKPRTLNLDTATVQQVLQELKNLEKPARGDSLARKYAGLFHQTPLDYLWRQTLEQIRAEEGANAPVRLPLFCAGIPPDFPQIVQVVTALCGEEEVMGMTLPQLYALITDCQEDHRDRRYGRVWNPPDGIVSEMTRETHPEKDPTKILEDDIQEVKRSCPQGQLRISRHFPKTVELLDSWLEEGLSVEGYENLTYQHDYGENAQLQHLLNHEGLLDEIVDLVGKIHRRLIDAIESIRATKRSLDAGDGNGGL